jgi:hypothetical protein
LTKKANQQASKDGDMVDLSLFKSANPKNKVALDHDYFSKKVKKYFTTTILCGRPNITAKQEGSISSVVHRALYR